MCVCVQQVNLHAAALCNAAANGRRICIYIRFAQTRYDDNDVGRAAAAVNGDCRVYQTNYLVYTVLPTLYLPMCYAIITLNATAVAAVENRRRR